MASSLGSSGPPSYTPSSLPILPGGDGPYTQKELRRIGSTIDTIAQMLPQAATKAPTQLSDGMQRLARDPWRPVAGQTTDQWVYYDAAGGVWRLLSTAPTNT